MKKKNNAMATYKNAFCTSINSFYALLLLCCTIVIVSCNNKTNEPRYPEPFSPEKALEKFALNKDFNIEIFAAEPYVMDPVDLVFDEWGNAYAVGMPDYPFQPEPGKEAGNIRMLIDSNKDGRIDKSVVFADKLSEATSILPWKGGLIVTAAPEILYLKDTTGDNVADIKEVLFTGFFKSNSEAQITSLRFGVDNWIYANNRGQAGKVNSPQQPDGDTLSMQGADFRFRLDRGTFELETGPGQFGQTINEWGHRFITENSIHIQHIVIPWRYMHRPATNIGAKPVTDISISDHGEVMYQKTPVPYWRAERSAGRNRIFKEQHLDKIEYEKDMFTAASGGTVYEGDAFAKQYYGNVFTGDVAGNLVHRDILNLSDSSPIYVASRAAEEKDKEFLTSTDPWFRPVSFTVGPDGYLYMIDYYRQHIETPVSIPDSLKTDMDFLRGNDMGRIYRIVPKNNEAQKQKKFIALAKMPTEQLVDLLANPNQWYRQQAKRLILERQDKSIIPKLVNMFSQSTDAGTRLHALYALEGLNALNAELVTKAMKDAHPGVREHGFILSEKYPQCLPVLLEGVNDVSSRTALQAGLSLGQFPADKTLPAFAILAEKHGGNPWFNLAILSSSVGASPAFLKLLSQRGEFFKVPTPGKLAFIENYFSAIALRNIPGEMVQVTTVLSAPLFNNSSWQLAAVKGMGKVMRTKTKQKFDAKVKATLQNMLPNAGKETQDSIQSILKVLP